MTVRFGHFGNDLPNPGTQLRVHRQAPDGGIYARFFKRALDVLAVLVMAPIILPATLVLVAIVALEGGAPIYKSARVGRNGRVFGMYKIRTMVPNASELLARHLDRCTKARLEWEATQKLRHDPRITRIGQFLRKSSLDELPQLWNVLRGEMSLVGPRPMLPEQRTLYPGAAYYELRPGLTGPWQVSERNQSRFSERAEFDSSYYQTLSFAGDVKLLFRTVAVVLRATGY